jgi:apolipoprotein N-acyltransferase
MIREKRTVPPSSYSLSLYPLDLLYTALMHFLFSPISKRSSYFLPLISGIISGCIFFIPNTGILSLIALVPLFFFIFTTPTPRKSFLGGFLYGITGLGSSIAWFFSTHPLTWVGITNPFISFLLITIIWTLSTLTLATGPAFAAYIITRLKQNSQVDIILCATALVTTEYARAFLFSLVWIAPEAAIGPHWTFGFLGAPLADTALLSFAPLGGFGLLSFIAALANASLAYSIVAHLKRAALSTFLPGLGVTVLILGGGILIPLFYSSSPAEKTLRVGVVHTDSGATFGVSEEESALRNTPLSHLVTKEDRSLDLLIFPEDTRFLTSLSLSSRDVLLSSVLSPRGRAIDSTTVQHADHSLSLLHSFYLQNGFTDTTYHKRFLIPFGEQLPYVASVPASFVAPDWKVIFNFRRGYTSDDFSTPISMTRVEDVSVAALFCSEIIPEGLYSRAVHDGADILVNTASHSVFGGSPSLFLFVLRQARVHAASHAKPFIHAGNGVPSFIIDTTGSIVSLTKEKEGAPSLLVADVAVPSGTHTPSTNLPFWTLIFSFIFILIFLIKKLTRRENQS